MKRKNLFAALALIFSLTGALAQSRQIVIRNEGSVNTRKLEFAPVFYKNGIVYTSSIVPGLKYRAYDENFNDNTLSLFYSAIGDQMSLGNPAPFAKNINTRYHEGTLSFDTLRNTMYFSRNNYLDGKKKRAADGKIKMEIYQAVFNGEKWDDVKAMPFNDRESNTTHPAISPDGQILYFSSDREGGFGGMDLYMVRKVGDEWGDPVNMGPNINSPENDIFPFIHEDGTLYFSSNRPGGFGGLDIYSIVNKTKVKNMGISFNSEFDDFSFIISGDKTYGYFSSNRPGGKGGDDIYSFLIKNKMPELEVFTEKDLKVIVKDEETNQPIEGAKIGIIDLDALALSRVIAMEGDSVIRLETLKGENNEDLILLTLSKDDPIGYSGTDGTYQLNITDKNYLLKIEKEGYAPKDVRLVKGNEIHELIVLLERGAGTIPFSGNLVDANGSPITGQTITLTDKKTGKEVVLVTGSKGEYKYALLPHHEYLITTTLENGEVVEQTIIPEEAMDANGEIFLSLRSSSALGSLQEGLVIELPNIFYDFNDWRIRPDAAADLDLLAVVLNNYPGLQIELLSHTDCRGGDDYNLRLSEKRAKSAVEYLMQKGIDRTRMIPIGLGESQLRNRCADGVPCTEAEHQYNRRTEIKVVNASENNITVKNVDKVFDYDNSDDEFAAGLDGLSEPTVPNSLGEYPYEVIAGTFSVAQNAEKRLQEVAQKGFRNASILRSPENGYYYVRVNASQSKDEMDELVRKIKNSGIECYLKEN